MKLVTVTMVGCDADIVETFVRFHCRFVDHMVFVLHGRDIDGSHAIIMRLQEEGLPLEVFACDTPAYRQSAVVTECVRALARDPDIDWILPLDCDEFLCATDGSDIRDTIQSVPPDTLFAIPWKTYIPLPGDTDDPCVLRRICHRKTIEHPQYHKILLPRSLGERPDVVISPGAHHIFVNEIPTKGEPRTDIALAHFPVRSADQLRRKILVSTERERANPARLLGECFHWDVLFDRCRHPKPIDPEELTNIALQYGGMDPSHQSTLEFHPLIAGDIRIAYPPVAFPPPLAAHAAACTELRESLTMEPLRFVSSVS